MCYIFFLFLFFCIQFLKHNFLSQKIKVWLVIFNRNVKYFVEAPISDNGKQIKERAFTVYLIKKLLKLNFTYNQQ